MTTVEHNTVVGHSPICDPVGTVANAYANGGLNWTQHPFWICSSGRYEEDNSRFRYTRLRKRWLNTSPPPEIEAAMLNAQLLEDYPDWWLGPSCLICGQTKAGRDLHIVGSYSDLPVTIITVYEPRPPGWVTPTLRGGHKR